MSKSSCRWWLTIYDIYAVPSKKQKLFSTQAAMRKWCKNHDSTLRFNYKEGIDRYYYTIIESNFNAE